MSAAVAGGLYVVALVVVLAGIGFGLKLVVDRQRHVAGGVGDRLVRGRAARHMEVLSRTLVVRAEPDAAVAVITPAMDPARFGPVDAQDGETAAWVTTLPPAAGRTRVVVRASGTAGWTEFGVVEYPWWSRFPQGARPYRRVVAAAADALSAAGFEVVERQREFGRGPVGPTSDGPRRALDLDPPGPGGRPVALQKLPPYEHRARRGEALAARVGQPDADAELLALLRDDDDTLVTRRTADALLARRDLAGLRLVLLADTNAADDTGTWLWSAVSHHRAAALGTEDTALRQRLDHLAASDPEPAVRERAHDLATYVFGSD